jgi:Fur family zinc uptake transcriptional regulator
MHPRSPALRHDPPTPEERVALAETLCSARGVQLTSVRRRVLLTLWQHGRPAGAYELMDRLRPGDSARVAPPTVYRALAFLIDQKLVSRIQSRNAYVPCAHPERPHDCLFFLCTSCGVARELEDQQLEQRLARHARTLGFVATQRIVEVEGLCPRCSGAEDA